MSRPLEGADAWPRAPLPEVFATLGSGPDGLATAAAARRLADDGPNVLQRRREWPLVARFLVRLANPLIAVLLAASVVSAVLGDRASFGFVAVVVLLSVLLDFVQEHRAGQAAAALQRSVALRAQVLRDGATVELPVADLVRGDIVLLAAGSLVPADGRVVQAKDLFVNQASLTGEAYPAEKRAAGSDPACESAVGGSTAVGGAPAAARASAASTASGAPGASMPSTASVASTASVVSLASTASASATSLASAGRAAAGDGMLADPTCLWMGSSVVSGSARMVLCATGDDTQLGRTAHSLAEEPPPTSFERGTRRFGMLLTRMTIALVLFVLLVNTLQQRPVLESFMFAVALAVGLTPELLPMIVSVTLARGAMRMARHQVIVKRLSAIEDLGAMDVLATDKTGTLTEARIRLEQHLDAWGRNSPRVLELACLNSHFETGLKSPLDEAILAHQPLDLAAWTKLDEVPFDFERRRVSVLVERVDGPIGRSRPGGARERLLVVKGAPEDILALCACCEAGADDGGAAIDGGESHGVASTPSSSSSSASAAPTRTGPEGAFATVPLDAQRRADLVARIDALGREGLRVLAVATRRVDDAAQHLSAADEHGLVFAGLLAFLDPPKLSAGQALRDLHARGIACKIVTGDTEAVTTHLAGVLGLPVLGVLSGTQVARLDDAALRVAVGRCNLFCRVTPVQKNRVVLALKARGHVVGYLGDGINDAPPLHSADIGISVNDAVDVAKQAADLVLLEADLSVLRMGVIEGRRTFVNVMKYIMMATSSNFGNMVSMAAAALFVPFLPMLPVQILLNNFLYDLSEVALPLDRVDNAQLRRPKVWDIAFIRNFMLSMGTLSSVFDLLTFALLIEVLKANEASFQTAWFVESMATQVLVVFVIRTRGRPWRSRPSGWLTLATLATALGAVALPFTPLGAAFGFVPLPAWFMAAIAGLTTAYLVAAESAKHLFFRLTPVKPRRRAHPRMGPRPGKRRRDAAIPLVHPSVEDHPPWTLPPRPPIKPPATGSPPA